MTEKLLVQIKGSKVDPEYAEQTMRGEALFMDYLRTIGIKTMKKDLIVSCHGNYDIMKKRAREIQKLADAGHDIAVLAAGGKYLGLPSLIASEAPTVPIISIPADWVAFLAPVLPSSGTAPIGGVSINRYDVAVRFAKEILTKEFEGVYLFQPTEKLTKKLEELKVPILGKAEDSPSPDYGLVVGSLSPHSTNLCICQGLEANSCIGVFFAAREEGNNGYDMMEKFEGCAHEGFRQSVFAGEDKTAAIYAAKIIAMHNPEVADILKGIAERKRNSYEDDELTLDSFV